MPSCRNSYPHPIYDGSVAAAHNLVQILVELEDHVDGISLGQAAAHPPMFVQPSMFAEPSWYPRHRRY
jgi:hypothetical protein